jgi:DNA-binding CsgD family transcriptional regulator
MAEWLVEGLAGDIGSLVALGRLDEARSALDELQEVRRTAGDESSSVTTALAARAEGLIAGAEGDHQAAVLALLRSLDVIESLPIPWLYERGRALLALGHAQRRASKKADARATLGQAISIFDELGSKLWAQQARRELDQISGRPSQTSALTETEARVAASVAAGRSNAEAARELFMSPKTVEWNLSKIYKKLHVRTRAELAAKLARTQS